MTTETEVSGLHTPGPWSASDQFPTVHAATGERVAEIHYNHTANARLIAAAPELLDACDGLLGLVQLICARGDLTAEAKQAIATNHRVATAKALVAKARATKAPRK